MGFDSTNSRELNHQAIPSNPPCLSIDVVQPISARPPRPARGPGCVELKDFGRGPAARYLQAMMWRVDGAVIKL